MNGRTELLFDAAEIFTLIESKIPKCRSFPCNLHAAIFSLLRALRGQWQANPLIDLRDLPSDFETWYGSLRPRCTAPPFSGLDGPLRETPYQPVELDKEFGEGFLKRGDLKTRFASLRAVAAKIETAVYTRRNGERADGLLEEV